MAKGGFLSTLNLQDVDGSHWVTLSPLTYLAADKTYYVVPANFQTDLASIPRGLWNVLPKTGKWDKAGVLHDWLYQHPGKLSRGDVDGLLREACEACGVGKVARTVIYLGGEGRGVETVERLSTEGDSMSFWSAFRKLFGFVGKEAAAHPEVVKAAVEAAVTKNPAPVVAAVEAVVDEKTGQ